MQTYSFLDASEWPVVVFAAPQFFDLEYMKNVMAEVHALRASKQPHAMVMDLTQCAGITAEQRDLITKTRQKDELTRLYCKGLGMVVTSPVLRAVMGTILLVRPTACPHRVFGSREAAVAWARGQMQLTSSAKAAAL